jgi:hypothetical protein
VLDVKSEGRNRLGFWSLLVRGTAILVVGGLFVVFLFS